jgi:hypothetical protein
LVHSVRFTFFVDGTEEKTMEFQPEKANAADGFSNLRSPFSQAFTDRDGRSSFIMYVWTFPVVSYYSSTVLVLWPAN